MAEEPEGPGPVAPGRIPRLIDHLEWANRRVLEAAGDAESAEALRLISHVLAAERVWLRRLETGDSSGLQIWPELSTDECAKLLARNVEAFRRHLRSGPEAGLDREVAYRNSAGRHFRTPAREVLLHVALHGSHHRGQITMTLRDEGREPVNVDFITFVREHPERGS